MPTNKSQHFVPQHYLRHFGIVGNKQVCAAKVDPFHYIGPAAISTQCKADYFYQDDGSLDEILQQTEQDLAPVLAQAIDSKTLNTKEIVALSALAVILMVRTKKAVEIAKVRPRKMAYDAINRAIARGELPPAPSDWAEDKMDFAGVAGFQFKCSFIPCWLEMRTLECKLLVAAEPSFFITSDNPTITMNQMFSKEEPNRSYAGFSRSGFQLLLPISPSLCLFFYDPKIYKVGSTRKRLITISPSDVELVNSMQIQFADKCVYTHHGNNSEELKRLTSVYCHLRTAPRDLLREYSRLDSPQTAIHFRRPSGTLKRKWQFCSYKRHPRIGPDKRRNPSWTYFIAAISEDLRKNPNRNVFESMESILGEPLKPGQETITPSNFTSSTASTNGLT